MVSSDGDLERLLGALSHSGARYLVVGGVAVVLHGYTRFTADLDLVLALEPTNVRLALAALEGLGYRPRAPVRATDFAVESVRRTWIEEKGLTVFSLWSPQLPATEVDLFVEEPFEFDSAYGRATRVELEGGEVTVASIDDLIALKRSAGRVKDLEDIRELQAIAARLEEDR